MRLLTKIQERQLEIRVASIYRKWSLEVCRQHKEELQSAIRVNRIRLAQLERIINEKRDD